MPRVQRSQPMFRILVTTVINELVVTGGEFGRDTDETALRNAIQDFLMVAQGLLDALMYTTDTLPTTLLSVAPVDSNRPTPFKLILHEHDAFEQSGLFVVGMAQTERPAVEQRRPYREACMLFWACLKALTECIGQSVNYRARRFVPVQHNVAYLDTPSGVRLASLSVQM